MLTGYTIIIPLNVSLNYYSDYIKKTVAILEKDNRIICLDYHHPVSLFTLITNTQKRKKIFDQFKRLAVTKSKGRILLKPISILPLQRYPLIRETNKYLAFVQLVIFAKFFRLNNIILWAFHPIVALLVCRLNEVLSIYDCLDHYGNQLQEGKVNALLEKRVTSKSDLIIFNSKRLYELKANSTDVRQKSFVIPMGCDYQLFSTSRHHIPKELRNVPAPIIGFVGIINYRLDFNLLNEIIIKFPRWSFVFLGPIYHSQAEDIIVNVAERVKRLKRHLNVLFIGEKPKVRIPEYIYQFDVGIIPYNTQFSFVQYAFPMKSLEYLACGKPVVSTDIPALNEIRHPSITLAKNRDGFSQAIKHYVVNWKTIDEETAKQFAKKFSWQTRIESIENKIMGILN